MAAPPSVIIIGVAGTVTFASEFYWEKKIDWKVPLATVLLMAGFEGLNAIDRNGATIVSIMAGLMAVTTKYNGHSFIDILTSVNKGTATALGPTATAGTTPTSTTASRPGVPAASHAPAVAPSPYTTPGAYGI